MLGFLNKHYPCAKALEDFLFSSSDYFQRLQEPWSISHIQPVVLPQEMLNSPTSISLSRGLRICS